MSGYLTTAGRGLSVANSRSVLAGWNPDETYWLADVLEDGGSPSDWHRDESHPFKWVDGRGNRS